MCGPTGLFGALHRYRVPSQLRNPGMTPIVPQLSFVLSNLAMVHGGGGAFRGWKDPRSPDESCSSPLLLVGFGRLMENHGTFRPASWVLDPFAGSGSLLIPAAHLGAVRRRLCLAFPLPSWRRHRLCLVSPLPSWPRHRLCLVSPPPSRPRHRLRLLLPLPSWPRHRLRRVSPPPSRPRHRLSIAALWSSGAVGD